MFRVHTGPMVRQIRWLGPENCEAVFAVLDLDHPSPDEELDHTRIRGLGPDGGQEAHWGDLLVQDPATEVWSVVPVDLVPVPRGALADLIRVAEYVSYGRRAVGHQPDGAPYPDVEARFALGALRDAGLLDHATTTPRFDELLAQIHAAEGAALTEVGQVVATAYIENGEIDENEFIALQNHWMTRLRSLVGPEEAARHYAEGARAGGASRKPEDER